MNAAPLPRTCKIPKAELLTTPLLSSIRANRQRNRHGHWHQHRRSSVQEGSIGFLRISSTSCVGESRRSTSPLSRLKSARSWFSRPERPPDQAVPTNMAAFNRRVHKDYCTNFGDRSRVPIPVNGAKVRLPVRYPTIRGTAANAQTDCECKLRREARCRQGLGWPIGAGRRVCEQAFTIRGTHRLAPRPPGLQAAVLREGEHLCRMDTVAPHG